MHKNEDGSILMIPKVKDILKNVKPGDFYDANSDELNINFEPQETAWSE